MKRTHTVGPEHNIHPESIVYTAPVLSGPRDHPSVPAVGLHCSFNEGLTRLGPTLGRRESRGLGCSVPVSGSVRGVCGICWDRLGCGADGQAEWILSPLPCAQLHCLKFAILWPNEQMAVRETVIAMMIRPDPRWILMNPQTWEHHDESTEYPWDRDMYGEDYDG